jgi:hypothetical protein
MLAEFLKRTDTSPIPRHNRVSVAPMIYALLGLSR